MLEAKRQAFNSLLKSGFLFMFSTLLLAGCAQEPPTTSDFEGIGNVGSPEENFNEDVIKGPPLPTTIEELAILPSGYTESINTQEDKQLIDELTEHLPELSTDPTTEQLDKYYEAVLSVFQQDFEGPGDLIDQLKFQAIGSPEIEDPRYQFKENLNVMVILDASGSMANYEGNGTRMDAAKNAITDFVKSLPEETNVGLRIYGHKGTGKESDQALSCSSSELIYPLSNYDAANFEQALTKATPAGWTPIGHALQEAKKDLSSFKGESNTNIVYLVSDGISTCDDDPVSSAKALYDSNITPIVNIIGFNVDQKGQKQLQEIAAVTKGTYKNVTDAKGLQDQLNQAKEIAKKWEQWKKNTELDMVYEKLNNNVDIFSFYSRGFWKMDSEKKVVQAVLTYLYEQKDKMTSETYDYLKQKNIDYHGWIFDEYGELNRELQEINEANYGEKIKELEEKYLTNTSAFKK